jgi:hypothetical protein
MYKKYGNKLMCFSPPVMLATFLIEFGLAFYTVWRYKLTTVSRLVTATLLLLGTFQLTEYMICGGYGLGHSEWARLGYVAITLMPAIGVHLVLALAKVTNRPLLAAAYATATAYIIYFVASGDAIVGSTCTENYAVFHVQTLGSYVYAAYYYGWLLVAIALAARYAGKKPKLAPALKWAVAGYASFIVPTTLANIIDPSTISGIPSIMCGFAVLLAIILVGRVLPLSKQKVNRSLFAAPRRRSA